MDANRLVHFENLVQSFMKQVIKTTLFVSLSCEACMRESVKQKVQKMKECNIKIFIQQTTMSQFEHYKFLCEQIDQVIINRTWCLFTDDDDYLSPIRTKIYLRLLKKKPASEVCVCHRSILHASWSDFRMTKEQLDRYLIIGKNNAHVVSIANEYVCYCVQLSLLKRFCNFMSIKGKLNTKMCDVVLGSMLYVLCKTGTSGDDSEWGYAYNQTSSHSRTCHKYGIDYYVETYDEKLFDDLADEFKFKWLEIYPKGCSFVYSIETHRDALAKLKAKSIEQPPKKHIPWPKIAIATISAFFICRRLRSLRRQQPTNPKMDTMFFKYWSDLCRG